MPVVLMYAFDMNTKPCLFCDKDNPEVNTIIAQNEFAYARWDNFPASRGHAEVVPIRHVESFFDLTSAELSAIYDLAKVAKQVIDDKYQPDAFNVGVNDGEAAGRTVHHVHVHLLPRYAGDVPNPRGGIRHIIPGKGSY